MSTVTNVDENDTNGMSLQVQYFVSGSKKLEDELQMIGLQIRQHETNIKHLKTQKNSMNDSILDLQVSLSKYHSSIEHVTEEDEVVSNKQNEEDKTVEHILNHENSAASILCQLKSLHGDRSTHNLSKDVVGIVATLGKVDDDDLSSILSEYLGMTNMLAVVCKTYEGVKALEIYDKQGSINQSSGLYGLGASIGKQLDGRFRVICLDILNPFPGGFVADDPQKRLDLLKPKLPNGGETPPGFLGFAVNMIHIDNVNLSFVTSYGHGLRETLFYHLFSKLQVYRSRAEMQQALEHTRNGAVSLDGGIIRPAGLFFLGDREDVTVKFPRNSGTSSLPVQYFETESKVKEMKWRIERLQDDVRMEQALLDHAKYSFQLKKQEVVKFLAENAPCAIQPQPDISSRGDDCKKEPSNITLD